MGFPAKLLKTPPQGGYPAEKTGKSIGYSNKDLESVPQGANLGLGCGNPVAIAKLQDGETVLDLGSGAGFDCFLASKKVGLAGKIIGVDMTPDMVDKARKNSLNGPYDNVEFRLGEIEHLPIGNNSIDVVISNCVINLSPDKPAVFREVYRVLKQGGRFMVSDIVLLEELPAELKKSVSAYVGCLSGAVLKDKYVAAIKSAGFENVMIEDKLSTVDKTFVIDPVIESIADETGIPSDTVCEYAENIMTSILVSGSKL